MADVHSTISLSGGGATGSDAGVADAAGANLVDVAIPSFFSTTVLAVLVALVVIAMASYYTYRTMSRKMRTDAHFVQKVVWITGASSDIGRALAVQLARRGALLILSGRDIKTLEMVQDEARMEWSNPTTAIDLIKIIEIDHDSPVKELMEAAAKTTTLFPRKFGRVDVLIHCAGITAHGPTLNAELDTFERLMKVNFTSVIALTKAVLPSMRAQPGGGNITVICGVEAKIGLPFWAAYSASKHALQGYFDSLRAELHGTRVAVTCIYPGTVESRRESDRTATAAAAAAAAAPGSLAADPILGGGGSAGVPKPDRSDTAVEIITAIANYDTELVVASFRMRALMLFRAVLPGAFFWMMRRQAQKEELAGPRPGGPAWTPKEPAYMHLRGEFGRDVPAGGGRTRGGKRVKR